MKKRLALHFFLNAKWQKKKCTNTYNPIIYEHDFMCIFPFWCAVFVEISTATMSDLFDSCIDVYINGICAHGNVNSRYMRSAVRFRPHQYRRSMVLLRGNYWNISYTIKFYHHCTVRMERKNEEREKI